VKAVFWLAAPCKLMEVYGWFRGFLALMMEPESTSATSASLY
jgi:hypothetical protein